MFRHIFSFQWECKSDMDNLYRFGEIEVVCEGYDYAEDPYITKGSCGLEYTLEYTKEGNIEFRIIYLKLIKIL